MRWFPASTLSDDYQAAQGRCRCKNWREIQIQIQTKADRPIKNKSMPVLVRHFASKKIASNSKPTNQPCTQVKNETAAKDNQTEIGVH